MARTDETDERDPLVSFPSPSPSVNGDTIAVAFQEHLGRLSGVVTGLVGDQTLAEDIVQDVFLTLLTSPAIFGEQKAALMAWLTVRARSRAIDLHRRDEARRRNESRNSRFGGVEQVWTDEVTVAAGAWDLRDALARIPENERLPIVLAFFAGQTYHEVSVSLGVPEGTIKSRIRAGLQRLRLLLGDDLKRP